MCQLGHKKPLPSMYVPVSECLCPILYLETVKFAEMTPIIVIPHVHPGIPSRPGSVLETLVVCERGGMIGELRKEGLVGDCDGGNGNTGSESLHIGRSYTSLGVVVDLCTWKQHGERPSGYNDARHNLDMMPSVYRRGEVIRRAGTLIAGHGPHGIHLITVDTKLHHNLWHMPLEGSAGRRRMRVSKLFVCMLRLSQPIGHCYVETRFSLTSTSYRCVSSINSELATVVLSSS